MTKQEKQKLEQFLEYIKDKVEDCYKKETESAIKDYLKEVKIIEVNKMNKKVKVLPVDSIINNEARKDMANRELEIRFYNEKENVLIVDWDGLPTTLSKNEYKNI